MQVHSTVCKSDSSSSMRCLSVIRTEMGVNLTRPRSPSGPPRSSGRLGRRSTPPRQDLIVNTYKYRGQSARMHKTAQMRSNSQQNLFYRVEHDFIRIMKLVSYFSELRLNYYDFSKIKAFSGI